MNDEELKRKLRGLPVPRPNEEARDHTFRAAKAALHEPAKMQPRTQSPRLLRMPWLAIEAFAVAVALFFATQWLRPGEKKPLDQARVFAEMEALFPEQLNAVVTRGDRVDFQLAATPAASDQRLLVEFTRGEETVRVFAYSGRRVCVELQSRVCFEPLLTADGAIVVLSEEFAWTKAHPVEVQGYRIAARPLPPSA